ncbi:MAG: SufS family cysteine desulfurase, partial [Polyangiales bacterium]
MSTSDPIAGLTGVALDVDSFEPATGMSGMGGLPSVDLIAQMANEFFKAMPGNAPVATMPSESDARSMPAYAGGTALSAPNVGSRTPNPGAGTPVTTIPTESDARGLSSMGGVSSAHSAVPSAVPSNGMAFPSGTNLPGFPGESDLRALVGMASGGSNSVPSMPTSIPGLPTSLPGGYGTGAAMPSAQSFYFLDESNTVTRAVSDAASVTTGAPRIESYEFMPQLVPAGLDGGLTGRIFDVGAVRAEFPILRQQVHGRPLIWLDNAATTQKPQVVIDRISRFYETENSNIHRAAHTLAARSTDAYEGARESARRFLNAGSTKEILFVRGATEGLNLIAQSWGRRYVEAGDEIILTRIEHHSNIVPWQMLASEKGAKIKVAPVDDTGQILLDEYSKLFTSKTKIVSITHVSNALGTVLPVAEMIAIAHRYGAKVVVDGAQAVSHARVDVQALDADFYVFSGHKVFGPTGIGVVYGKEDILNATPPWQGGGNMIADVTFEKTIYHPAPWRFEAGTGNIADAVGLGAALDWISAIGLENVSRHEHGLLEYGTRELLKIPGLRLIGTAKEKAGVMSFVLDGIPTEEIGRALDLDGIAVRSGHH